MADHRPNTYNRRIPKTLQVPVRSPRRNTRGSYRAQLAVAGVGGLDNAADLMVPGKRQRVSIRIEGVPVEPRARVRGQLLFLP